MRRVPGRKLSTWALKRTDESMVHDDYVRASEETKDDYKRFNVDEGTESVSSGDMEVTKCVVESRAQARRGVSLL